MLLAIDTSTSQLGLALYQEANVLGESCWTTSLRHTHELAPSLQNLLERCSATISEIQAIGDMTKVFPKTCRVCGRQFGSFADFVS